MRKLRICFSLIIALVMACTVFAIVPEWDAHAVTKPTAPQITSLKSTSFGSITVKASATSNNISGLQVQYSKDSSFPSTARATYRYDGVSSISKTYSKLTRGAVYYVRVRAYVTSNGTRYYGAWSSVKSVKAMLYYSAYITRAKATFHRDMNTDSKKYSMSYRTKVLYYGLAKTTSTAYWYKIKYDGTYYYLWQKKTEKPYLSKTRKSLDTYRNSCETPYQLEVVDKALDIYQNWPVYYANGLQAGVAVNGKYPFDCATYTAYVINETMQEHVPAYRLTTHVEYMHLQDYMYNRGLTGEVKVETVCTEKPNLSALQPGDLVFFNDDPVDDKVYDHVGIYLGDGDFIHCTKYISKGTENNFIDTKTNVCISPLKDKYYDRFMKAVRVLPEEIQSADQRKYISLNSKYTTSYTPIYSDFSFNSSTKIGNVYNGTKVTLLYTSRLFDNATNTFIDKRAYIKLPDGTKAFIDIEKLSDKNPFNGGGNSQ